MSSRFENDPVWGHSLPPSIHIGDEVEVVANVPTKGERGQVMELTRYGFMVNLDGAIVPYKASELRKVE